MDPEEGQLYKWFVGEAEVRRISELVDYDVRKLGFLGFNMNTLPKPCPHCGKPTEVLDWCVERSAPNLRPRPASSVR